MRILILVAGVLIVIAGWSLYVLESGVSSDKSYAHTKIISHLSIIFGSGLISIASLKKRK